MPPSELQRIMVLRYGSKDWKSPFAREFDIQRRTVQRWARSTYLKGMLALALRNLPVR